MLLLVIRNKTIIILIYLFDCSIGTEPKSVDLSFSIYIYTFLVSYIICNYTFNII